MYFQRHVRPTPYILLDNSPTFYEIFDCFVNLCCILTLSDFRTYIYVRNSQTVATPVRIYTYTDFAIGIWGF